MFKLILASRSKVRKDILDRNNILVQVQASNVDEDPITANALQKEFATKIDFHGQHDQQLILKKENPIDYLDSYCKHQKKVDKIREIYEDLVKSKNKLN